MKFAGRDLRCWTPAGVEDISRWLSAAIPPEQNGIVVPTLKGSQRPANAMRLCDPSRVDERFCEVANRWYRYAQPPANFCDPDRGDRKSTRLNSSHIPLSR